MTAKYALTTLALLLISVFSANAAELPRSSVSGDTRPVNIALGDEEKEGKIKEDKTRLSREEERKREKAEAMGKVRVCVLSVCEEDPTMEASIREAAEAVLMRLKGVAVSDVLEESSVLISFVAFKERDSQGMQTGRVVYSFAYGTPDLDFADGILIALPRYLHHEAILATRGRLEQEIAANINEADRDFFQFLRGE